MISISFVQECIFYLLMENFLNLHMNNKGREIFVLLYRAWGLIFDQKFSEVQIQNTWEQIIGFINEKWRYIG